MEEKQEVAELRGDGSPGQQQTLQQKAAGERVHEWVVLVACGFFPVNIGAGYLGLGSAQPHICCFRVCTQPMSRIGWKSCM